MTVRAIEDIYPLSPTQQGMLSYLLTEPGSRAYFEQFHCVLEGDLDVAAFAGAWRSVIDRHPVLRTAFEWQEVEEPLQVVLREVPLPLLEEDWRQVPKVERQERLEAFLCQDRDLGFALDEPPLMRLALLRLDDRCHRFVWSHHHLLLDGWCRTLLLKEVFAFYEAAASGRTLRLERPRPYRDYIAWWKRQDLSAAEDYWRRELAGWQGASGLSPQGGTAASMERSGDDFTTLCLNGPVTRALESLGRRHGLTLNTLVQGAWAILLSRYTGTADVTFGVVVSGRPPELVGVELMIGLFINSLPLRIQVDHRASLLPWLALLQARQAEVGHYGYVSLAEIRRWSDVPPGQRLFDSLLAFQNFPMEEHPGHRLGVRIAESRVFEMSEFPLSLVAEPGSELFLWLGYDRRLFDQATAARMLGHCRNLLEAVAADPARCPSDLPLLAESEKAQVLLEWNDTDAPAAGSEPVHELFARRARSAPERPAVIWQGGSLSFGDLDRRAARLAHRLRRSGVGADTVVGLLAGRSPDLLAGILGVLKAGGAFLPLDPVYPRERLRYMVEDSRAAVVLTHGRDEGLPFGQDVLVLPLDDDTGEAEDAVPPLTPSCLAYLLYTSGSTGRPKGVGVPHGALTGFALEMAERLRLAPDDRVLQFASPAFDVLIEEVFPAWVAGAAVVVESPETLSSPRRLGEAMQARGVTVAELPSVYWHEWVEDLVHGGAALPANLRLLLLGSEKPSPERLVQWERLGVPLVFVFGLTETTVTSSLFEVPAGHRGELPIGRPVGNTRLYVLDAWGGAAPIGVPGELYVGGAALARGYLGRPELTAARFVPDPWGEVAGARLYRTGDRARHRPDGHLEFLGRLDDQVKVRGFRVELGEIETALRRHPAVREAAVVVREDAPGDRRLVAYLCVAAGAGEIAPRELRDRLSESLPDHMLPSAFVVLPALPLTPNGKLDRKALPPPEVQRSDSEPASSSAPRNPRERLLLDIWKEVLGVGELGIHDNFFELGGDSILSIQVAARAHGHGLELAPWQLFEQETVAKLAASLEPATPPTVDLDTGDTDTGPLPLTPIQHWFFEQDLPERAHWNMPLLLSVREPAAPHLLAHVLRALAGQHEALRSGFAPEGGAWLPFVEPRVDGPSFLRLDLASLPRERAAGALEAAAASLQASFDLARPPLLRAAWFDLDDGARLLLVAHHLVVDAVSWRILVEDLERGYRQVSRSEPLQLPPAPAFSRWARGLAAHAVTTTELDAWLAITGTPVAPLPKDHAGGRNLEASARTVRIALSPQHTRALLQELPRAVGVQVQEALLAALAQAFAGWTGERRLRIDLEGHGREPLFDGVDVSRTVGWFATMFPVLLEVSEDQDLEQVLEAIKHQVRRVPGRGIGYGLLRYLGGAEARAALRSLPPAPVLFNYLGQLGASSEASGLFALVEERIGPAMSPRSVRSHLLEVNAWVAEGALEVEWTYGADIHHRSTIESVAERFLDHLRALAAFAGSGASPLCFPLAGLDPEALERLNAAAQAGGEIEDVYPLSPLQQGMLFHSLYEPGAGMYVAQLVCDLEGELSRDTLVRAWGEVLQRHSALRTTFFWQELDHPVQVVFRRVDLPWSESDLRDLPAEARRERLETYLAEDRARGFDVSRPPLLRLRLFRTDASRYWLVLTLHQMLLDGWSLPLVLEDALTLYEADRQGAAATLPHRPPYRDYIAWLLRQDLSEAEAFWRRSLAGFSPDLGLLESRPSGPDEGYGEEHLLVPRSSAESAREIARAHRVTLNTLLQASWGLLLGSFAGTRDVVFGAVVSGRPAELPGIESAVGLFINTLPVRLQISEVATIAGWLRQIQEQQAEMRRYEHTPLVEIQRWAGIPAHQPLFESILVFQSYPVAASLAGQGAALGVRGAHTIEQTNYGLTLVVEPGANDLRLGLSYPRRRFQRSSIQRMLRQLQTLLAGLGTAQRPLEVSLLTAGERQQILHEWNDSGEKEGVSTCFHHLFEAQAARTPDRVAVVGEEEHLTYAELDRRAGALAARLRRLGMAPEARVGICLERSPQAILALLGVLKAGGAYVPLDPAQPRERLAMILEGSGASFLLTQEELLRALPTGLCQVVCLDRADLQEGDSASWPEPDPSQLAYVIFTSGSTGRPKGVAVEHRQLVSYVRAVLARLDLPEGASFATVSSLATDLGNTAIFPALCSGGRLHVIPEWRVADAAALEGYGIRHPADCLKIVPSHLAALLSGDRPHDVLPRARLVLGGEAADRRLVARLRELAPRCEILNHYGPTETTVGASTYRFPEPGGELGATLPVGRPLPGVRLLLLGWDLQPAPIGAPGEVFIGGAGVARGYLGDPAQTAERFLPDPWGEGTRLYRTGDLGRLLPDGAIELLGRIDHQVKVRGHRIETTEIEAVLRQEGGLLEAVVAALGETPGERRLVAYVVLRNETEVSTEDLRLRLSEKLPDFMVPSAIVRLAALPRLPSGKVDRRALPVPGAQTVETGRERVFPRSELEEKLAAIWSGVLGVEDIGVFDDFFQLGGHSLLATQVASRIRREFQVDVPLRSVFDQATIASQAVIVAQLRAAQMESDEIARLLDELEELSSAESAS